ncbi:hypothetical protein [Corynebacterium nasicanis]|uniref:Secreted protein n=1 Tax=Corynebacterium nasicanis TaxID=1448267 RepID=A0ABW1QA80_9CORY
MTVKKTLVAALALTVPLTFAAACGSGETVESTATGVPTQSTVTSTRTSESTTPTSSSEEPTTEESTVEPTPEPEAAPAADPLLDTNIPEPEPVQGGHTANAAEQAEIEHLVRGIYEVETFHQMLRYIPENTCHEAVAAQGGAQAMDLNGVPDSRLADMPQYATANPHIQSVTDVRVDGNRASAVVTAVSAGQTETRTQRYLHEDGRWKFCT